MNRDFLFTCLDLSSVRKLLEFVAGERGATETKEAWFSRIAKAAGLEYRTVRGVWYGEKMSFETAFKIKQAAKHHEIINRNAAERFERHAETLLQIDTDFYREEAETYRSLARRIRNLDGGKGQ